MIIINNKHFFGNEKHLKCEKIIILLEKLATYSLALFMRLKSFFLKKMSQSRINETLNRKFTFPVLTGFSPFSNSRHLKKLKICMHK